MHDCNTMLVKNSNLSCLQPWVIDSLLGCPALSMVDSQQILNQVLHMTQLVHNPYKLACAVQLYHKERRDGVLVSDLPLPCWTIGPTPPDRRGNGPAGFFQTRTSLLWSRQKVPHLLDWSTHNTRWTVSVRRSKEWGQLTGCRGRLLLPTYPQVCFPCPHQHFRSCVVEIEGG